ncbi:MAG TPA: hypothetical protein VI911_09840 [Patescibacteria group bacterium]|nr:hypothetical protein [Patescibacteria group bacterium]
MATAKVRKKRSLGIHAYGLIGFLTPLLLLLSTQIWPLAVFSAFVCFGSWYVAGYEWPKIDVSFSIPRAQWRIEPGVSLHYMRRALRLTGFKIVLINGKVHDLEVPYTLQDHDYIEFK